MLRKRGVDCRRRKHGWRYTRLEWKSSKMSVQIKCRHQSRDGSAHFYFSDNWTCISSQLPCWLRWCRICLQGRRPDNPWVRKSLWRREWQPTPVFLPGESHGQRSLPGYSPWGRKGSVTTRWPHTHTHTHTHTQLENSEWVWQILAGNWLLEPDSLGSILALSPTLPVNSLHLSLSFSICKMKEIKSAYLTGLLWRGNL